MNEGTFRGTNNTNKMETQSYEQTMKQLRAEVKLLISKGSIRHVPGGVEDLSEETLRELISEYKESKLKTVNETICVTLVNGFTTMCKTVKWLPDESVESMREELLGNEGFMTHTTSIIGKVTPCIPYVGFGVGMLVLGKYLYDGVTSANKVMYEEPNIVDNNIHVNEL